MQIWYLIIPLLLSSIYWIATQLAQPPSDLKPKIFVLGLSKTGTTSIGDALALLGYKRLGWKDIRSRHLVGTFIHGDLDAALEQTKHFDAFEDLPWPYLYREAAQMYPDAKFVLSLRSTEQKWLKSLRLHMSRGNWEPATFFYGADTVEGNEEVVLQAYRNHTDSVRQFFQDQPDRYEELIIDDGNVNWEKLCKLARCPDGKVPTVDFPRSNTAAHWHDGEIIAALHWFWGYSLTWLEEQSTALYYQQNLSMVRSVLDQVWHIIDVLELATCRLYFRMAVQNQPQVPV
jgi:hypothetical protein